MVQAGADKGLVLVTGGSGFVGGWCVVRLLQDGWRVRTTVRDLKREPEVRAMVAKEVDAGDRLSFARAELMSDAGWAEAVAGCTHVLHVASPIPDAAPADENELIAPARDGTLRVLRAAVAAGVRRVVATSSMAAIAYGHPAARYLNGPPFTEADWTDPTSADATPCIRSKAIAERAARDFMAREGGATEFATVNPAAIFGPALGRDYSPSLLVVERLLNGALPGLPRLGFATVDVRDVADLHLLAMTKPEAAGGRYPAGGPFLWFADVGRRLREILPAEDTRRIPTRTLPDWLLRLVSRFDPQVRGIINEVGRRREMSDAASRALGWTPRPLDETLRDTAASLKAVGALKA